jgi:hypothetical protein
MNASSRVEAIAQRIALSGAVVLIAVIVVTSPAGDAPAGEARGKESGPELVAPTKGGAIQHPEETAAAAATAVKQR